MNSKRRCQERRGALTVEFAITAPIAFLLVMGLIEFSHILMLDNTAENAAYEAARAAIVPGGTVANATAAAQNIFDAVGTNSPSITLNPTVIDDSTSEVTATVEVPLDANVWLPPSFTNGLVLRHSCTLRRERTIISGS